MTVDTNWRDEGACRDADPDLFFPFGGTGPALLQMEMAKRLCRVCPVQIQCLAWALEIGIADGIWGGTTPEERPVIRVPPRRKQISQEDDGEHRTRAQAAQATAARILRRGGTIG